MPVSTQTTFQPKVELINSFLLPYDNAVATARTCYSSKLIYPADVSKDAKAIELRDKIAESIYAAGHHTTLQHATFQFALDRVSRQFIWSFLHAHPFYNSEQVSQRYVTVKPESVVTPPMNEKATAIYTATVTELMQAYEKLKELTYDTISKEYLRIYKGRNLEDKRWANVIKKKQQEVARYILPVGTAAHLYHTISGLTLHRYNRLQNQFDTPTEQKIVVSKMIEAINAVDPLFFSKIEDPIPLEQTVEYQLMSQYAPQNKNSAKEFIKEFDAELNGDISKLIDYKVNGEKSLAQAVRSMLGLTKDKMTDEKAIELVMSPSSNHYFGNALNLTSMAKITRALNHVHFTFKKKISHTADSQDQRHRMTPGSRPILETQVDFENPDYLTPEVIAVTPEAKAFYDLCMQKIWKAMGQLLDLGISKEFVMYLLPNAFPIRFEESGDLAAFHHKWVHRLCYTAQEEIWNASKTEVEQVSKIYPQITKYLSAPCTLRKMAGQKPFCPEGDRFCGVPVWTLRLEQYQRII